VCCSCTIPELAACNVQKRHLHVSGGERARAAHSIRGGLKDGAPRGNPLGSGHPWPPCSARPRRCHSSVSARAASIRSLSFSLIYYNPHHVGCGCMMDIVFQVFHLDVTKVDLDVAYVFKCFRHFRLLFQYFIWMLQSRSGCCICCNDKIRMLQAYASIVSGVSDVCCKCFM
jgi:hypothetical protein